MQPTRELWRKCADLLAADTTGLASATAMHLHIFSNPVTVSLDMQLTDFVECTFTGSGALNAGTGVQPDFYDAGDGLLTILIKEPAGGWTWTCTVDPVAPENVYGCFLTDNADAVLLGAFLLDNPVTILAAGQGLNVARVTLKFSEGSPF